jgi:galactose mutarotase-like enzyme
MTAFSISKTRFHGFECLTVNNGMIELAVLPELGSKIVNLRDVRTGREWLWRHPRMQYKRVPHGSSYVAEADTGGWDECFPSVSACEYPSVPWQGAAIQDHGELWSQSAEFMVDESDDGITLLTEWRGYALPYIFRRSITLAANSAALRVDYSAQSVAFQPVNFVWCIHPLLAIEPDMQLLLPPSASFNVSGSFPEGLLDPGLKLQYPFTASGLDLPGLPAKDAGRSIKIWSDPLPQSDGWAALRSRDGELRMRWDTSLLPQVAVWMNFGAWAGDGGEPYFNLGLEPCIGAQDSLADAVNHYNLFASLPPHGTKKWWLEIELSA